MNVMCVFLGGGAGSVLRYLVGLWIGSTAFPWATFAVNAVGSLASYRYEDGKPCVCHDKVLETANIFTIVPLWHGNNYSTTPTPPMGADPFGSHSANKSSMTTWDCITALCLPFCTPYVVT
jgi:hypothetical protein